MIDHSKKISLLVGRLVPPFVIDDYPKFAEFIKTFLRYIEREKGEYDIVANLLNYNDIDSTLVDFEHLFKNAFAKTFPAVIAGDVDLVVKNVRDYYKSKGTEDSFRFLFNTIFNTTIQISYPKFQILKASDGIWYAPQFMLLTDVDDNIPPQLYGSDYNVNALVGQHIIGMRSGAESYIVNTAVRDYLGNDELFIELSETEGGYEDEEMIIVGDNIVYNGSFNALTSGWFQSHSDDYFYISDGRYVIQQIPAEAPSERYAYQELEFTETGTYHLRFTIHDADAEQFSIRVGYTEGGSEIYETAQLVAPTYPYTDLIELPSFNINKDIYISLVSNLLSAEKVTFDGIGIIREDALTPFFFIAPNSIQEDAYQWVDTRGFISSDMKLQDNYYYQDYSYDIKSNLSINKYRGILKDNIHPAGYIMFGSFSDPNETIMNSGTEANISNLEFLYKIGLIFTSSSYDNSINMIDSKSITYAMVENYREDTDYNGQWYFLYRFDNIIIGDFETSPNAEFYVEDGFLIKIGTV